MLFIGDAGVGKTTVASVLCEQLDLDMMFMNARTCGSVYDMLCQPGTKSKEQVPKMVKSASQKMQEDEQPHPDL